MKQLVSILSYNDIVEEHFRKHRIIERLQMIENLIKLCGEPAKDSCLKSRIVVIYTNRWMRSEHMLRITAERS